jgi:uncharacterized protein YciI
MKRVVVRVRAGPTWDDGPIREQPGWDDHAVFIDDLVERGLMVMGGPFSDNSGSLMLFEGVGVEELRALLDEDPFVQNGVFVVDDVREWTVFVDTLG